MPGAELHIETLVLHGAYAPEPATGAAAPPIFQSTSFAHRTAEELEAVFAGREAGFVYTRIGNPTLASFERRMAVLEDGIAAVSCASGMAAISAVALTLAGAGDEIVSGASVFGGTHSLFKHGLSRYGITTRFVEATDVEAYRRAIGERTRLVFVETIGNPRLDVPDLAALAAAAHANGVPLVVDNTLTTPVLLRPKTLGADIVVHSTSKFINGHGTAVGGVVVDCGAFDWSQARYAHLRRFYDRVGGLAFTAALRQRVLRELGFCCSPFNAFLTAIGVESLVVRVERHCSNALAAAEFLSGDARVEEVRYPGLPAHREHELARRQFGERYGALLTLRLGAKERCFRFINGLKRAQNLANLGDAKTLVIHPASTICRGADEGERRAMGVTDDLVRFSIGIEHVDDIVEDIDASLALL